MTISGPEPEALIVGLPWRACLAPIAGVAVLFIGTAAASNITTTDVRQGGVVVGWVRGGDTIGDRSWVYCDDEETWANDGRGGRVYVFLTHDNLGWAVRVGANSWKVLANPELTGRSVLVGRVVRQSPSRWNIVRAARQPLYAQWVQIKPRLVAQAVGRDGVAAGASFLLLHQTCRR